jgi:hypothetical protein
MGIINSKVPQAASFNPSTFFMSGILLAQLEKQIPMQKYRQKIASRVRRLDTDVKLF